MTSYKIATATNGMVVGVIKVEDNDVMVHLKV